MWSLRLVHRGWDRGVITLARPISKAGKITESDRRMAIAFSERLAAPMAAWHEGSTDNPPPPTAE